MKNFKIVYFLLCCTFFIMSCGDDCPNVIECNTDCKVGNIESWDEETCMCITSTIVVAGCMDETANNFNPSANCDDGSCDFGCPDPGNCNTECTLGIVEAWVEASCECLPVPGAGGCTNPNAINYDSAAICDNGSCECPPDPGNCNTDCTIGELAIWSIDQCACVTIQTINGCTNPLADNYNPIANCDDGSCDVSTAGCTDPCATNFDPQAVEDDGSCDCARDAFIGDYLGSLICPIDPVLMAINTNNLNFNIGEVGDITQKDEVNFTFSSGAVAGISLFATVCENQLSIPETSLNNLPIEAGGIALELDLKFSGEFTIFGNYLEGILNIEATQSSGPQLGSDSCEITANKQ